VWGPSVSLIDAERIMQACKGRAQHRRTKRIKVGVR